MNATTSDQANTSEHIPRLSLIPASIQRKWLSRGFRSVIVPVPVVYGLTIVFLYYYTWDGRYDEPANLVWFFYPAIFGPLLLALATSARHGWAAVKATLLGIGAAVGLIFAILVIFTING